MTGQLTPAAKRKRALFFVAKCFVSGALILFVLLRANVRDIWLSVKTANLALLVSAFLLTFVGYLIGTVRWRILLRALDISIPFWYLVRSYLVGIFFNNFLPSTVGGDAMRIYDSWKYSRQKAAPAAVVFMGRLLGVFALILFAAIAVLFFGGLEQRMHSLRWIVCAGLMAVAALIGVLFFGKKTIGNAVLETEPDGTFARVKARVLRAASLFRGHKSALVKAVACSILLQANVVLHYFLIARSVDIGIGFANFFLVVPLAILVTMLPVTINGIGIREGVYVFFFGIYGVAAPVTIAYTWIGYAILLLNGIIGGFVYIVRR